MILESIVVKKSFIPNTFWTSYYFDGSGVGSGRKCVAADYFAIGDNSIKFRRVGRIGSNRIYDKHYLVEW
jgi:hypothetical protein